VSLISDALNEAQREANKRRKESQPALLGGNPISMSPPSVVVAPQYRPWTRIVVFTSIAVIVVASVTAIVAYRHAKANQLLVIHTESPTSPAIAPAADSTHVAPSSTHVVNPSATSAKPADVATNTGRAPAIVQPPRGVTPHVVASTATHPTAPGRHLPIRQPSSASTPATTTPSNAAAQPQPRPTSPAPSSPAPSPSAPRETAATALPQPRPAQQQDLRVTIDPTVLRSGDSLFIRAYTEHTRGNLDAAADLYERALTKPPVSPELYNDYGALLATRGKHAAAIAMYNLGIAANDKDGRLWANLGDSYRAVGRRADAMSAYFEAVTFDPMNVGVKLRLAAEYASLGDTASARRGFDEAVRSAPSDPEAHYRYGAFLQTQHDVAGAIRELQAFVDLAPGKYPTDVIDRTKAYIASLRRSAR
jgi:Tfp pilus assembly protein PilF